ncbi:MAG: hypothetical protein ACRDO4_08240 [Nocardioides sp.]
MFPPGFYIPDAIPPGLAGAGTVEIDPEALATLKAALVRAAELLESGKFQDLDLADSAFGARPAATELGSEHRTAHAIISDTITGVINDLWGYRDGVTQFETGMSTADDGAAADLTRQQSGVEALAASSALSNADSSYHESQRDNLSGQPDVTPPADPGSSEGTTEDGGA